MSGNVNIRTPRFDLSLVDPQRRIKMWNDALHEHFYSYETEYPQGLVSGHFDGMIVGDLRIASITTDPMFVDRGSKHIAKDGRDAYYLLLPRGGDIQLMQSGNETTVRQGQFTFVSTTEPYSYRQKDTESFHTLVIPGSLVRARRPDADHHLGADFNDSGLQRVFADFADSFCRNAASMDEAAFRQTHGSLLDMLALVLERIGSTSSETSVQVAHRRRILNLIRNQFHDPRLGIGRISQALGLSPRYVQHVLAASGETVSDLLRRRRIMEACRLLERREASRANVAMTAYAVGYLDPAYFSRVFRQSMGMSPTDYGSRARSAADEKT